MKQEFVPTNEAERLATLLEYKVLDTPPELAYDDITAIASFICGTPISLVSLVDRDRQWFKSKHGLSTSETPRDISFCTHAIQGGEVFVVRDTFQDKRFADNPLATGVPHVRFYAGAPLVTPTGRAVGTLCVIDHEPRDLTSEQKESLQALARQIVAQLEMRRLNHKLLDNFEELQNSVRYITECQAKLTLSAKMAALGEMSAGISHEINNPLAIIRGKLGKIRKSLHAGETDPKELDREFETSLSAVTRISNIVRGLRLFSRDAAGDPMTKERLSQIVADTLGICQERFQLYGIKLEFDCQTDMIVECRPAQISQVLLNLLSNAHDAAQSLEEKWVKISVFESPTGANVSVTDSGTGIRPDVVEKMMQPFFTTKEVGKGTGLGLSISLGIAQSHNGRLIFDRSSSRTSFVLELPLNQ